MTVTPAAWKVAAATSITATLTSSASPSAMVMSIWFQRHSCAMEQLTWPIWEAWVLTRALRADEDRRVRLEVAGNQENAANGI